MDKLSKGSVKDSKKYLFSIDHILERKDLKTKKTFEEKNDGCTINGGIDKGKKDTEENYIRNPSRQILHCRSKSDPEVWKPKWVMPSRNCTLCQHENYLRFQSARHQYLRNRLTLSSTFPLPCNTRSYLHQNSTRNHIEACQQKLKKETLAKYDTCDIPLPPLIRNTESLPPLIHRDTFHKSYRFEQMQHFDQKASIFPFNIFDSNEHHFQNQQRNVQVRFSSNQSKKLEKAFETHKYITNEQRKELSKDLCLSERQVKTWFQNRRAKWRRIKLDSKLTENNSGDQLSHFKYY